MCVTFPEHFCTDPSSGNGIWVVVTTVGLQSEGQRSGTLYK